MGSTGGSEAWRSSRRWPSRRSWGRWPRAKAQSTGKRVWTGASTAPWARTSLRRPAWMRMASPAGRRSAPSWTGPAKPTGPPRRNKKWKPTCDGENFPAYHPLMKPEDYWACWEAHVRRRELPGVPPADEARGLLGVLGGHHQGVRLLRRREEPLRLRCAWRTARRPTRAPPRPVHCPAACPARKQWLVQHREPGLQVFFAP